VFGGGLLTTAPAISANDNLPPRPPLKGVTATFQGNKKPLLMARRGDKASTILLIFPRLMMPGLELAPVIETSIQSVAVVSSGQSLNHST
jgi:hypothetical protein